VPPGARVAREGHDRAVEVPTALAAVMFRVADQAPAQVATLSHLRAATTARAPVLRVVVAHRAWDRAAVVAEVEADAVVEDDADETRDSQTV